MKKKIILVTLFVLGISLCHHIFASHNRFYEAKWNVPDTTLAITIDGEISTTFPTASSYDTNVSCTNGTGKVEWNGSKWVLSTSGITKGSSKCNVTFTKLRTLADEILLNNEIKSPISTPGKEVSAYTLNDLTSTSESSVFATEQAQYVTYGTGWEANGTKFNLTGVTVTSDTYLNSYSKLVGKYLSTDNSHYFGSSTAEAIKNTTNLSCVYYVVSASSSKFSYKELCSNKNITEAELASTEDDYGTSYYFRGAVKNNYVQFANKCWRIVRIVGDGAVKLVLHNDNASGVSNPCSSENNNDTAAFVHTNGYAYEGKYNDYYNDNAYVGLMYGTAGSSDYASTHANIHKSTVLSKLETWYTGNLTSYADRLADIIWCNDKSVSDSDLGYSDNDSDYGAYKRLYSTHTPTLKCPNDNNGGKLSKLTVSDTTNGNGSLYYKIGLLTGDEIIFAGLAAIYIENSTTYLYENAIKDWWTMSPALVSDEEATIITVTKVGGVNYTAFTNYAEHLRPAIALTSSTIISGGSGTSEDPYIVK